MKQSAQIHTTTLAASSATSYGRSTFAARAASRTADFQMIRTESGRVKSLSPKCSRGSVDIFLHQIRSGTKNEVRLPPGRGKGRGSGTNGRKKGNRARARKKKKDKPSDLGRQQARRELTAVRVGPSRERRGPLWSSSGLQTKASLLYFAALKTDR